MKRAFCMSKRANSPARTRSRGSCRCRRSDGAGEEERLLAAQEVLKSRLLLSPFEEFALTLDFKLSKVARAAVPSSPAPPAAPGNHPNRVGCFLWLGKKPLHTLRRVTRVLGAARSCYSVINMNYV